MAYTTIDDPSAYFQIDLYTGTGSTLSITNDGNSDLQPDLIWIKNRSDGDNHMIYDSSRGATKRVIPNTDGAEATDTNGVTSFNSDGATMGDKGAINTSSENFAAWQWKANGGSTTTNDASATSVGTIDSVYQANTTAGFSIVSYTGTGSAGSLAHGLGATPHLMIVKNRSKGAGESWLVYHHQNTSAPETDFLLLNSNNATADSDAHWNDTAPTSTVFSVKDDDSTNDSGETFISYLFTEIQGYSKFGSYKGNENADGPFVYTGFKPALVILKNATTGENWCLFDNKRSPYNEMDDYFEPNTPDVETDGETKKIDFLSNGFKIRGTTALINLDGDTHIYIAFAHQPFVTSGGVPCTAI